MYIHVYTNHWPTVVGTWKHFPTSSIGWPGSASSDAFQGDLGEVDLKWWNTWQVVNPKSLSGGTTSGKLAWEMENWAWRKMCFQWRMGTNFFCYCILPRWYQFIWVRSLLAIDLPAVSLICYDEFVASLSVEAYIFYFSLACPSWYFSYLHIIYMACISKLQEALPLPLR